MRSFHAETNGMDTYVVMSYDSVLVVVLMITLFIHEKKCSAYLVGPVPLLIWNVHVTDFHEALNLLFHRCVLIRVL